MAMKCGSCAALAAAALLPSAGAVSIARHGPLRGGRVAAEASENELSQAAGVFEHTLTLLSGDRHLGDTDVSYEDFLPKCLEHLAELVKTVDEAYTDEHLEDVLKFECDREPYGNWKSKKDCLDFADALDDARKDEQKSGEKDGYVDVCKKFWEHSTGDNAPKGVTVPSTTTVTTTATTSVAEKATTTTTIGAPTTPAPPREEVDVGKSKCQCIGIDGIGGETHVHIEGTQVMYPGDLGGSCSAWDESTHPECKGPDAKAWCMLKWCYVDPCSCDIDVAPKPSTFMPDAKFQGKPLYFSYATCDNEVELPEGNKFDIAEAKKTCDAPKDPFKVGFEQCRCIGIAGQSGTTITKDGVTMPAEVGATCGAWEQNTAPECKVEGEKPAWCSQKWCYVDPCSCNLPDETPPKLSTYLPGATFQNKPLYYSYGTCLAGAKDHFTPKNNPTACVNQQQRGDCDAMPGKCAWHGGRCIGKELAGVC